MKRLLKTQRSTLLPDQLIKRLCAALLPDQLRDFVQHCCQTS